MSQYFFKLHDPLRSLDYYPVDADHLVELLQISKKTAIRICKHQRKLKQCELVFLQTHYFGFINDPYFLKQRCFFYKGALYIHGFKNFELNVGEIVEFQSLRLYYTATLDALIIAKEKIKELELIIDELQNPKPTNIIKFSDFRR